MQLKRTMGVLIAAGMFAAAPARGDAQEQGPPMPKPGPEHEVLKADAGVWDAKVEVTMAPGLAPMVSTGVETNTVGCGGLCLISDFKSEFEGQPFHGHGLTTWDPAKKKYVGSWVDSMSAGLSIIESTWDPAAKRAEGTMAMPEPSGGTLKARTVVEYSSPDTRTMTSYMTGPDGKEFVSLRITYTRRK